MDIDSLIKSISKDLDFTGDLEKLSEIKKPEIISFGLPSLDAITGIGGIARGYISEIFGNPSSGKTSLALSLIAQAQKQDINCCFIDVELALTKELAQQIGVDIAKLVVVRPAIGEEVFEIAESMSEKGFGLIVIDSIASISPISEIESDYEDVSIGLQARLMSKAMRKLIGCIYRNKTALVFINQIRAKMAKMPGQKQWTTSGGIAVPFYAALRLEVARIGWIKEGINITGMDMKIKVEKNKLGIPQRETVVKFLFGKGFQIEEDILTSMLKSGEVELIGRTFYVEGRKIGNKEEMLDFINKKAVDKLPLD